jgi:RNA polymerase sigma factor (TIGR02999 family)
MAAGRPEALDRLIPVVYEELQQIARGQLRRERADHTLSTSALVHEAYLRLVDIRQVDWQNRVHFFATAAQVMRRLLIDFARARKRDKRGGGAVHVTLSEASGMPGDGPEGLLDLEDALQRLEARNARQCRVVECRCFAGLTVDETAEALEISAATVKRDWAFARAWLNRELRGEPGERAQGA